MNKPAPSAMPPSRPHSIEAEQAVFAAMLINPDCRPLVKKQLRSLDFYWEKHRHLADAIFNVDGGDVIVVLDELRKRGLLGKAGGSEYLISIMDSISTSAGVQYHIDLVKEASLKRQLIILSQNIIDKASSSPMTSEELGHYLRQRLNTIEIRDRFGYRGGVDIANVFTPERCLEEYSSYIQTLKENRFITGIHEIDKRIRGVAGGEVLIIIARAGSFKTAMLQNLLWGYVQNSAWGAIFFSIEMPVASVTERYHTIIRGTPGRDIEELYLATKEGASQIREGLENAFTSELKNLFVVPSRVCVMDIAAYIRLIERQFKVKVGVIGIDYLGLMDGPGQGEYEIVSKLAKDIKGLAKLLNIPVIFITQTSRKAGSGDVEIELDMARGSGAIEESADVVLGLFQVEKSRLSTESREPDFDLICKILKNRKGKKFSRWLLHLDPSNLRLGPNAEPWEPPKKRRKDVFPHE
jgi:replicative DNA helicase